MLVNVAFHCLSGLSALHETGIVHGDVNPGNLASRIDEDDNSGVTLDLGLSSFEAETPELTDFRSKTRRDPRYLSPQTHATNTVRQRDDLIGLIYTLGDFWKDGLPWEAVISEQLIVEMNPELDLRQLLPEELHFLVGAIDGPEAAILEKMEQQLEDMDRDGEEEMQYIDGRVDSKRERKLTKYIFEDPTTEQSTTGESS
jgi:serine/threonine protein kinase